MRVLITGGTGSLGNELTRQILETHKEDDLRLIIFSRDEHKQEEMQDKFNNDPRLRFFLGDVRDKERLKLAVWECDLIIHAAALKRVVALEYNPSEAMKTNVIGTQNLIEAVYEKTYNGVYTKVIGISTDKAVSPTNLYGSTKHTAEKLLLAANNIYRPAIFSVVRYGNVAGSRGSVIPKFLAQKKLGNSITLTDDRMTRFYITINQAAKFVLDSAGRMQGGEIFIPYMESFKVKELAELIDLLDGIPNGIQVTGIRPGEKLHEEIISEHEAPQSAYCKGFGYYVIGNSVSSIGTPLEGQWNSSQSNMHRGDLKSLLQMDGFL